MVARYVLKKSASERLYSGEVIMRGENNENGVVEDERNGLTDMSDQRFYANDYDNLLVYS